MLLEPANIITNRPFKNIELNFSTKRRTHENLVLILTNSYDDYNAIFKTKLFKPQQLFNVFTPKYMRPYGYSKLIKCNQNDIYDDIAKRTNNKLYIGKVMPNTYNDRNLVYNIIPEYLTTFNYYKNERKYSPVKMHSFLVKYIPELVKNKVQEIGYAKNYIIFPVTKSYKGLLQMISRQGDSKDDRQYDPLVEFLKTLKMNTYNANDYKDIERIIFVAPDYNAVMAFDPQDIEIKKNIQLFIQRLVAMSNGAKVDESNGEESGEIEAIENTKYVDSLDSNTLYNNKKEELKQAVLQNIGSKLKAKLDDYSAGSTDEQAIINRIDKKVDDFMSNPDNIKKTSKELISDIENDKDIVAHAVSLIQTKTATRSSTAQLVKNIKEENKIVSSLLDIYDETDNIIDSADIKVNKDLKLDKNLQKTKFNTINTEYNKKQAEKDKIAVFSAFSNPENIMPLTIVGIDFVDSSDLFNEKETATVKYKTIDGRVMSVKVDIPKIVDDCFLYLSGNKYVIGKQLVRLPIVKTETKRVEITTNFQKMTLETSSGAVTRRNAYLIKLIESNSQNLKIQRGTNEISNNGYVSDPEVSELAKYYNTIENMNTKLYFNRKEIEDIIKLSPYDYANIDKNITPIAINTNKDLYYTSNYSVYKINLNKIERQNGILVANSLYEFFVEEVLKLHDYKYPTVGHSYIYSHVKFLTDVYPILVIVAMNIGLTQTLRRANVKWHFSHKKEPKSFNYVEIQFKDGYFYFEDTPINSMLLSVLHSMPTDMHDFAEFDTSEPFADYCIDVMGQPNYTKRMTRINIEKMIDPITFDVLKTMKLPTNIYDLLILGSSMLVDNDRTPFNDMSGFRIRGNEVIYGVLYSVLSDAYRKYQQAAMHGSKVGMVVKQNAVITILMSQQNISVSSTLNPLKELEEVGKTTPKGFKGVNLDEAYKKYETRIYSDDMRGYLSSNSTAYSGKVGVSRSLTYDPNITHVRGYFEKLDENKLNSGNLMSATELLMFASPTHNDSPRVAMEVGQTSNHQMPTVVMNKQLVSSGANYTIHKMLSKNFIFRAKNNGIVEKIDDSLKLCILKYVDGTYDAVDLSESQAKNTASGFYTPNKLILNVKENDKFEKDQVIAFNSTFFAPAHGEVEFLGGTLAKFALSSNDACFEDAGVISERLSEKCASKVTVTKEIALKPNCNIIKMVNINDHVSVNDVILEYTDAYDDPSTIAFINKLNAEDKELIANNQITTKVDGVISDIDIYYNIPYEELSESIKELISTVNKTSNARIKLLQDMNISAANVHIKNSNAIGKTKIDQKEFEGILIKVYIEHLDKVRHGDKLTASVANKITVSQLNTVEDSPITEFRPNETVDVMISVSGFIGRMTVSLIFQMYLNKLLIELGRTINDIINDREPHK